MRGIVCAVLLWLGTIGQVGAVTADSQIVAKIIGQKVVQDTAVGMRVLNDNFQTIRGSDLGAVAVYKNRIYFLLGDTLWGDGGFDGYTRNFIMAYSKPLNQINKDLGIELEGYVGQNPTRLITDKGYFIPNALFTINLNGQEYLFAHYMDVVEVAGNDHHIFRSGIVKYNESTERFDKYKDQVYKWEGSWRHFGMASFWVDYTSGYIYMMGSPSGRFGGAKLAKMTIGRFLDPNNNQGWEYRLENNWSTPTTDFNVIRQAAWMIPPKDPNWSITKDDWENYSWEKQAEMMTIGEFSITYNSYLNKYLLLTGKNFDSTLKGGAYYYSADNIWGPWSQEMLLASSKINGYEWEPYGVYTTSDLNANGGQTIYYVATSWGAGFPPTNYGVYWYKTDFGPPPTSSPTLEPTPTLAPKVNCGIWCSLQNPEFISTCSSNPINSCNHVLPGGQSSDQHYCVKRTTKIISSPGATADCGDLSCNCYLIESNKCPEDQVCGLGGGCNLTSCEPVATIASTPTPSPYPLFTKTPSPLPTNVPTTSPALPPTSTPTPDKLSGDANGDGRVDLTDQAIWKKEYLEQVGKNTDFNSDGKVDMADLGIWKTEYVKPICPPGEC